MNTKKNILLNKLINYSKHRIIFPFYHLVDDSNPQFSKNLYTPRKIENFRNDLVILLKYFKPITIERIIEITKTGEKLNGNYFHLSFDDGLSNFYEVVAPILLEKNIPATVFLNTDFIDNKDLFFRYKASLLIENYKSSNINIKKQYRNFIKNHLKKKSDNVEDFLINTNYKSREILDLIAKEINYSFQDFLNSEKPYLSIKQIKELEGQGITFGGHSATHPIYSELSLEEQINQTKTCMNWIKDNLKTDYKVFSFPFDDCKVKVDFFKYIEKQKIYDLSFGTSGLNMDEIDFNFQRIWCEIENKSLENYLIEKYIKHFIKKFLFIGKISRKSYD